MTLQWSTRQQPLPVEGMWVEAGAARTLRQRLLVTPRAGLRLAENGDRLVILGPDLPWVEGAVYLGRSDNLYLPTLVEPSVPQAWIAARLSQLGAPPWALIPPGKAMGLSQAAVVW